ncbi:MAG: hypothetical protein ACR2H1_08040, partial [Limisphaerales bacterium]
MSEALSKEASWFFIGVPLHLSLRIFFKGRSGFTQGQNKYPINKNFYRDKMRQTKVAQWGILNSAANFQETV